MKKTATTYIDGTSSIAEQREACRRAADRLGANVTREYIDYHRVGRRQVRTRMMRYLLKERRSDFLLVVTPDRLTRNSRTRARMLGSLDEAGVRVVAAADLGDAQSLSPAAFECLQRMQSLVLFYANCRRQR
jgi:DNA invertase Pin-like site-specific DNA recombinase